MPKNRTFLLVLVSLALGALVLLDNWGGDEGIVTPAAPAGGRASASAEDDATAQGADAETAAAVEKRLANPLAGFDKSLLKDWVERPLFTPGRQRPPQVARTASKAAPQLRSERPPASYDLLGIVRDGDRAIALLRKKGEGTSFRVEVGDMIGGWRVAKMEPASVVLERTDGTSETVQLKRQ